MSKNQPEHKNYVLPIAIMFALFFMIAFVTGYQNPLGDVIKGMTGGNVILSQLGTLANFLAYLCCGIPAGRLLERTGYRKTALTAVSVGFIGVFITYISGYITGDNTTAVIVYLIGAFVAGFSMCLLNTVVNPMLNSLGKNQNEGNQLVQFGGTCNSLGATLAPIIVGGLIGGSASSISSANPVFFMAMGIFLLAFLVLFFTKLPESPDLGKAKASVKMSGAFKYSNLTFGLIAILCYMGIEVGVANWTYQYLSSSELVDGLGLSSAAVAGSVCGIYWLLMLVGRFIGGSIGAKVSSRAMLTVTSALGIVLLLLAIFTPESGSGFFGFDSAQFKFSNVIIPLNAIFMILVGLCTSVMWGSIFNLSVEGLGKYTPVASGLFMTMVFGGGVFPTLQGVIAGSCGILASFWLPLAFCAYILAYALFLSHPSRTQPLEEEDLYEDGQEVKI